MRLLAAFQEGSLIKRTALSVLVGTLGTALLIVLFVLGGAGLAGMLDRALSGPATPSEAPAGVKSSKAARAGSGRETKTPGRSSSKDD